MTNRERYEENQKKIRELQEENKRLRLDLKQKKDVSDDIRQYALEKGFPFSSLASISKVIRAYCFTKEVLERDKDGKIATSKVTSKYGYMPYVSVRTKRSKELTDEQFEDYERIFKEVLDVISKHKMETESISVFLKEHPHFFKGEEKVKFKKYLEEMERENEVRT